MSLHRVPTRLFFAKGTGQHKQRAVSRELALRDAGLAAQNLVRVSSIFPPNCKLIPRKTGEALLKKGAITFVVLAENANCEPQRVIASSIGVAMPIDNDSHGYLAEHHSFGETEEQAGDHAEDLAAEMLAATLGEDFSLEANWDEEKNVYRIANKVVRTANVTQSAVGDGNGLWTTTVAAAVFLFDE